MAVLHDYVCLAHGEFSSFEGKCKHGCGDEMVKKMFAAPAILSGRTRNIDSTIKGMAQEHGLTDMNNRGGGAVFKPDANFSQAQQNLQAQMMSGKTYAGSMGQGANAIQTAMSEGGFKPDNAIDSVRPLLTKPKPNVQASWDGKS